MAAIELATGQRVWERNFAGVSTPWVAGDFIYVVTLDAQLICLTRGEGKVIPSRQVQILQSLDGGIVSEILVKEGQQVTRGQKIAEMGNTDSESVKLHFEIRKQGKPIDPSLYLPKR